MKNVFLILLLFLSSVSIAQKKNGRDLQIEYEFDSGTTRYYHKKYDGTLVPYAIKRNVKIYKGNSITVKVKNYNPLLYDMKSTIKKEEIVIAGDAKDQFIKHVETISEKKEPDTTPQSEEMIEVSEKAEELAKTLNLKAISLTNEKKTKLETLMDNSSIQFPNSHTKSFSDQDLLTTIQDTVELYLLNVSTALKNLNNQSVAFKNTSKKLSDSHALLNNLRSYQLEPYMSNIKAMATGDLTIYIQDTAIRKVKLEKLYTDSLKSLEATYKNFQTTKQSYQKTYNNFVTLFNLLKQLDGMVSNASLKKLIKDLEKQSTSLEKTNSDITKLSDELAGSYTTTKNFDWKNHFLTIWYTYDNIMHVETTEVIETVASSDKVVIDLSFMKRTYSNNSFGSVAANSKNRIYEIRVKGGARITASVGFMFSYLPQRYNYSRKNDTIVQDKNNSIVPVFTNMIHAQFRSSNDFSPAISFGVGIPVIGEKNILFFLGGSAIIGSSERLIISAGFSGGQITKLSGGYKAGEYIAPTQEIPLSKDSFSLGGFIGVSFNLRSATN